MKTKSILLAFSLGLLLLSGCVASAGYAAYPAPPPPPPVYYGPPPPRVLVVPARPYYRRPAYVVPARPYRDAYHGGNGGYHGRRRY